VRGGGFIETPNQRVLIESRGQTLDVAALAAAVVPAVSAAPAAPATAAAPAAAATPLRRSRSLPRPCAHVA
jgi:hypothetical protein